MVGQIMYSTVLTFSGSVLVKIKEHSLLTS